jgi:hypothetical protein
MNFENPIRSFGSGGSFFPDAGGWGWGWGWG